MDDDGLTVYFEIWVSGLVPIRTSRNKSPIQQTATLVERNHLATVGVHHKDLVVPISVTDKGDPVAIRGPIRRTV